MYGAASGVREVQWSLQLPGFHLYWQGATGATAEARPFLYLQLSLNPASWLAIYCAYKRISPSLCMPLTAAWEVHPVRRPLQGLQ